GDVQAERAVGVDVHLAEGQGVRPDRQAGDGVGGGRGGRVQPGRLDRGVARDGDGRVERGVVVVLGAEDAAAVEDDGTGGAQCRGGADGEGAATVDDVRAGDARVLGDLQGARVGYHGPGVAGAGGGDVQGPGSGLGDRAGAGDQPEVQRADCPV